MHFGTNLPQTSWYPNSTGNSELRYVSHDVRWLGGSPLEKTATKTATTKTSIKTTKAQNRSDGDKKMPPEHCNPHKAKFGKLRFVPGCMAALNSRNEMHWSTETPCLRDTCSKKKSGICVIILLWQWGESQFVKSVPFHIWILAEPFLYDFEHFSFRQQKVAKRVLVWNVFRSASNTISSTFCYVLKELLWNGASERLQFRSHAPKFQI